MMEEQVERKRAEIESVKLMRERIRKTLEVFRAATPGTVEEGNAVAAEVVPEEEKREGLQGQMWDTLDDI